MGKIALLLSSSTNSTGVETIRGEMGTFTTVGSSTVVTNKGMLVNPEVKDDELELLSDLFKVPVKVGTANFIYNRILKMARDDGHIVPRPAK